MVAVVSGFGVAFLPGLRMACFLPCPYSMEGECCEVLSYKATGPIGLCISLVIIILNYLYILLHWEALEIRAWTEQFWRADTVHDA